MFGKKDVNDPGKKKRIQIHETTLENDIQYLGPLTGQHFKILGWLCIVAAQAAVILKLGGRINGDFAVNSSTALGILGQVANFSLPFLLIANFAQLLHPEDGYRKLVLINCASMAGVCAAFYLVFYRYIVGGVAMLLDPPSDALSAVGMVLGIIAPYGFFCFNLFVDLLLCTLTMLFLNYKPRHVFAGRLRILFRLLALLPVAYEVGCMILKVYSAKGMLQIPVWAWPLLPVKPPMTFVLFVILALFIKTRELRFRRHGKTHEEYKEFLKTRRNSRNFSLFLAVMLALVSIADIVVVLGFSVGETVQTAQMTMKFSLTQAATEKKQQEDQEAALAELQAMSEKLEAGEQLTDEEMQAALTDMQKVTGEAEAAPDGSTEPVDISILSQEEQEAAMQKGLDSALGQETITASIDWGMRLAEAVGFGKSVYLILLAPLVLLFSYTRRPKNGKLDLLIPVAGLFLILLVYIEGFHQLLGILPVGKLNLQQLGEAVSSYAGTLVE